MQATFKPRQDKIDALNKDIAALSQQLQSSQRQADAAGRSRPAGAGTAQAARPAAPHRRSAGRCHRVPQRLLSKSSEKMQAVVKKLAEEKGLDLVVDASTALYFKEAMDITKDAIAAYDKAYPAEVIWNQGGDGGLSRPIRRRRRAAGKDHQDAGDLAGGVGGIGRHRLFRFSQLPPGAAGQALLRVACRRTIIRAPMRCGCTTRATAAVTRSLRSCRIGDRRAATPTSATSGFPEAAPAAPASF